MSGFAVGVRRFIHEKLRRTTPEAPGLPGAAVFIQRLGHVNEELGELTRAFINGDVVGFADGVGDAVYILYGLAADAGIDLDAVLAEIHASNMTKRPLDADGKGGKGDGFRPPDLRRVLFPAREPTTPAQDVATAAVAVEDAAIMNRRYSAASRRCTSCGAEDFFVCGCYTECTCGHDKRAHLKRAAEIVGGEASSDVCTHVGCACDTFVAAAAPKGRPAWITRLDA